MFDIGWSELLVIAVATLIVVGPKDLPVLLRTIGRYVGILKRQASEFRAQFDDAIRDTEFDQLKQDVESIKSDFESSVRDTTEGLRSELSDVKSTLDDAASGAQLEAPKSETAQAATILSVNQFNSGSDESAGDQTAAVEDTRGDGDETKIIADASKESDSETAATPDDAAAPKKSVGA
jgi:sec-independent protein translocase protein TatB